MQDQDRLEQFYSLMQEYTGFLEKMLEDENEKLAALNSRELARIEHSITLAQANAKQLENYESHRIALQQEGGFADKTFRQLVEEAPEQKQGKLQLLFDRFERSVNEIRFFNDKSMSVARDSMLNVDPAAVLPGAQGANPYAKIKKEQDEGNGMLETKV